MKTATIIFLVALTISSLFLESTTAPNPPAGEGLEDTVKIDDAVKEEINKAIESSGNALTRAKKVIARALSKATGDYKNSLTEITAWLDDLEGISNQLHTKIKDAVATGSVKNLNKIVPEISKAIEEVKTALVEYSKVLKGKVKPGFKKEIETVMANAAFVRELLKSVKGVDAV